MSKFDDCITLYNAEFKKLGISADADLLRAVTRACGPAIYNPDSSKVSSTDPEEVARVKNNFVTKKLGISGDSAIDAGIASVIETMGSSNRNKYRAMFYYLLVKHFKKEAMFG